jgi:hypothetical protein
VGIRTHYSSKFISHNIILLHIILFLSKIVLIFSYILIAKINTHFLINLKLKEIMYLNVFMGDNAIFQEQKIQEFSCNSYDDVGVF